MAILSFVVVTVVFSVAHRFIPLDMHIREDDSILTQTFTIQKKNSIQWSEAFGLFDQEQLHYVCSERGTGSRVAT